MPEAINIKKHLLVKRAKIMKFLKSEGYNNEEIAVIFNMERSWVSRILKTEEKYKEFSKRILSDKNA